MNNHAGHGAGPVGPEHGAHAQQQHATTRDAHGGHDRHAGHSVAMFRDKFWVSLLLTLPTLVWGHMLQRALGYTAPVFPGSGWIPALFGTAVFVYGGVPFLRGGIGELKHRLPREPPRHPKLTFSFSTKTRTRCSPRVSERTNSRFHSSSLGNRSR